jgi:methionine synthase I (cobalamin-dependent)
MDGAMGTQLLARGLPAEQPGAMWNLTHPRTVSDIHAAYVAAGARVLLTNTFQSNPIALARHGLDDQLDEINGRAIDLARRAPGGRRLVLGDVGPILSPGRYEEFADREALHRTLASLAGVDGVLFETCSTPAALAAVEFALHRAPELDGMPLLLSLTYLRKGGELQTFSGHRPETFARHAARHGVCALGVNCGRDIGPSDAAEVLRRYRAETDLPLFARPNAGSPSPVDAYPLGPERLARHVRELVAAGATMVGGCCGTTPSHTRALGEALRAAGESPAR